MDNAAHKIFGDMRYLTPEENERKKEMYRKMSTAVTDSDSMDFCGVVCNFAEGLIKKAKAEAIREFAERFLTIVQENYYALISHGNNVGHGMFTIGIEQAVNETIKEMVGEE
jgi:hypothetical protein